MTKLLQGLSGRPFTFALNTGGEMISAREAFDAFSLASQPFYVTDAPAGIVQAASAAAAASAPADISDSFDLDFGEKLFPDFGLPCITDEKLLMLMAHDNVNGGAADRLFTADGPIDGPGGDEGIVAIAVGGTAVGYVDFAGDTDLLTVSLVAGQRYMFSLRGTSGTPVTDTFLELFNPGADLNAAAQFHDDDGGIGTYSIMTVTAATTGTYTIRASSFANPGDPGLGEYTVDVRQMGTDTIPANLSTTVVLNPGITFGFRETATQSGGADADFYKVHLDAGHFYSFAVAASADYENAPSGTMRAGEIDTIIALFNSSGVNVGQNDDNSFPSDVSSTLGYFAQTTGDYYFDVTGYSGTSGRNTGGYVIDFHEVDISSLGSPLDSIDWVNAVNMPTTNVAGVPTVYVYFAVAGENFGENARAGDPTQPAGGGNGTLVSYGWTQYEKDQFLAAMQEYNKILGINYVETSDSALAAASGLRVITNSSLAYGAYAYPQDPAYGTQKGIAVFNVDNRGWNLDDPNPAVTTDGLGRGGYAWSTILHEMGHAHGLAHPHDTGGGSEVMAGVGAAQGQLGVYNLNQQVYTQMSYNGGWWTHPDGSITGTDPTGFRSDAGWEATLGAFDIAELQLRYGVHPDYATGDTTYLLNDVNQEGTYFECIYDTAGTDTIAYNGVRAAQIDLMTATIDYSVTGGGVMSFVHNVAGETAAMAIKGGYTIANGVVIENATGGSGNDVLLGNNVANTLTGNNGNDSLMGRGGDDMLLGGAGTDTAYFDGVSTDYTITKVFDANGYLVTTVHDNNAAAPAANGPAGPVVTPDDGTDTLLGVESMHFSDATLSAGNILVYDENDALVGSFATIQSAVNASHDGYTIQVGTGTYNEQVTVNNLDNLTIEAAPNADVVIQAPATLAATSAHAAGHGGGLPVYGVLTAIDSLNLTINGIDIDGAGAANSIPNTNDDFVGVFLRNSSGTLNDVDITGMHDPYPGGTTIDGFPENAPYQRGSGVVVDNDTLLFFTMTGGSISDFQKNGGRFWDADLNISGVTVTGGGAQTGPAQNGFIVDSGTGNISGNTISEIGYAGPVVAYSVLIYIRGADNLNVTDNILTGTNDATTAAKVLGVAYYDDNDANNGGLISGNTISWVDTGIDVEGDLGGPAIVINGNTVTNIDFTDAFSPSGVYFTPTESLTLNFDIDGSGVHDYLAGASDIDNLSGLGGDDEFDGNGGNDVLSGDGGTDQADYAGNYADYTITYATDAHGAATGFLSVTDNNAGNGDEGADTLSSIEVLQFANITLDLSQSVQLYDGSSALVGTFDTIQAAIDAASNGYRIVALAGTYNENLTVDVDVTIQGANSGTAGNGARGAETIIDGQITIAADGVTIDGVSIVGDGAGVLGSTAVMVNTGSDTFSLVNSVLNSNSAADFAIFVAAAVSALDVGHNLIEGYSIGAYISGGTTSGSVHDNLFQGDGGPFTGLGNGVNSETSHVLIQNNTFDGIYANSMNLFPFGPDPVDLDTYVIGNIFTNSGAERVISIYPTADSTHIIGTDENEAFNGDTAGLASGTALAFDGQGGNDHIYGFNANDALLGGSGADLIFGFNGNDIIDGGTGIDTLNGGAGNDSYYVDDAADIVNEAVGDGFDAVYTKVSYTLAAGVDVEWLSTISVAATTAIDLTGNSIAQYLIGNAGANTLNGGAGADLLYGLGGNDTYIVDNAGDQVFEGAGNGFDAIYTSVSYTLAAGQEVEWLSANDSAAATALNLTGNEIANYVVGNAGVNTLNGGGGADLLYGFAGNDTYFVDNAGDQVFESVGAGFDAIYTSATYVLAGGQEVEWLSTNDNAATTAIDLTGNAFAQFMFGNNGNNVLNGGGGADNMYGYGGNDTYYVDNAGDTVTEGAGGGYDTVYTSVSYTLAAGAEVEVLQTDNFGSTAAINLHGSNTANTIYGNAGANVIDGGGGADLLLGFGGADTFAFTTALGAGNIDLIADFTAGSDKIALDDAIFTAAGPLGTLNANAFFTGSAAHDADDRIIYNSSTGQLFYDADGNGAGAAIQFATVNPGLTLAASDFLVI